MHILLRSRRAIFFCERAEQGQLLQQPPVLFSCIALIRCNEAATFEEAYYSVVRQCAARAIASSIYV
ncbi:MAG: hypothetical protein DMG81_05610 [Acidobacteria bacterium]|nr:MAG: hypothetical protein DMG81_05610 [Acidobacteriota bacterium]